MTAAGDHPDLIVYGEMSWSNHHIGQDGSEDALHRGGSNVYVLYPAFEYSGIWVDACMLIVDECMLLGQLD